LSTVEVVAVVPGIPKAAPVGRVPIVPSGATYQ
jgi:hypothetical protein